MGKTDNVMMPTEFVIRVYDLLEEIGYYDADNDLSKDVEFICDDIQRMLSDKAAKLRARREWQEIRKLLQGTSNTP